MTTEEYKAKAVAAAEHADWVQVVLNGGPPCFWIDERDGHFCLRAQRWHGDDTHHFVPLDELLATL